MLSLYFKKNIRAVCLKERTVVSDISKTEAGIIHNFVS